ncbi:MAG: hypothetical protein LUC92_04820 [Clostridiales bacterium]|nr:hypothetical protein [Clostridiales bacterium]
MNLHEVRHCCSENIAELKEIETYQHKKDNKKIHFPANTAVRIAEIKNSFIVASELDEEQFILTEPADKINGRVINNIINSGLPKLTEVIIHKDKTIQVLIKTFPERKILNYSVNITDDFLTKSFKAQVQIKNFGNPIEDLREIGLYKSGDVSFAVVGLHMRSDRKKEFDSFVIAGSNCYIHICKKQMSLTRNIIQPKKSQNQ